MASETSRYGVIRTSRRYEVAENTPKSEACAFRCARGMRRGSSKNIGELTTNDPTLGAGTAVSITTPRGSTRTEFSGWAQRAGAGR